jgi:hypothetical protein
MVQAKNEIMGIKSNREIIEEENRIRSLKY